jgi:hypothetical protein
MIRFDSVIVPFRLTIKTYKDSKERRGVKAERLRYYRKGFIGKIRI